LLLLLLLPRIQQCHAAAAAGRQPGVQSGSTDGQLRFLMLLLLLPHTQHWQCHAAAAGQLPGVLAGSTQHLCCPAAQSAALLLPASAAPGQQHQPLLLLVVVVVLLGLRVLRLVLQTELLGEVHSASAEAQAAVEQCICSKC
jgi:hypothetical protein